MNAFRVAVLFVVASIYGSGFANKVASEKTESFELRLYELFQPFVFNCSLSGTVVYVSKYEWSINGTALSAESDTRRVSLEEGGAVLRVLSGLEDDFGNYTCRVGGDVAGAWRAEARPLARFQSTSIDFLIGEDFEISCELIGKPYGPVTWHYSGDGSRFVDLDFGNGSRFSIQESAQGVPGGVLVIRHAEAGDSGLYTCIPPRNGTSGTTALRAKEENLLPWILTGLCIFLVIILVIFCALFRKTSNKSNYLQDIESLCANC